LRNTVRLFYKMNTKQQYTKKHGNYLRFKRWSRAKYAVFASISSCVSIGKVKVSIADCLLKKQENSIREYHSIYNNDDVENKESEFSDLAQPAIFIDNFIFLSLEVALSNKSYNYSFLINYINQLTTKVDAGILPSSTFFIQNYYV